MAFVLSTVHAQARPHLLEGLPAPFPRFYSDRNYNAVESKAEISFRQIHRPSGRRINYEKTVPGVGKVDNADIVKGYEVEPDQYVILEPSEIEAVKLESKKTIDLVQFVDASDIDSRYFERPYFIAPADKLAGEGYVVIRDALRKTGKVGLAQVTIGGREWLVAISPLQDGLTMAMLRYPEELRKPEDFFDEVPTEKPTKEMVDLAVQLITQKSAPFRPEKFEDHYQTALAELVKDKLKSKKIIATSETPRALGGNVVDLMAQLKASVEGKNKSKTAAKTKPTKSTKKSA